VHKALTEAGFTEEFFGDDSPPATHYRLGDEDAGFYAEFLTPLVGSEVKRGKRDATVSKAGITAQKLRYLDVLSSGRGAYASVRAACDLLQVGVDVASHPSRGREQADVIRKRVLNRVIEGEDPRNLGHNTRGRK
jgi:hypothetical protein